MIGKWGPAPPGSGGAATTLYQRGADDTGSRRTGPLAPPEASSANRSYKVLKLTRRTLPPIRLGPVRQRQAHASIHVCCFF